MNFMKKYNLFLVLMISFFITRHPIKIFAFYTNMPASFVIGQTSLNQGNANQGGSASGNTVANPYNVFCADSKIFIADYSNSRVLIYNHIPESNNVSADVVVGQQNMTTNSVNQGGSAAANTLQGVDMAISDGNKMYIADPQNHRVLIYNSIPETNNASADVVVGQTTFSGASIDQGGSASANTLHFPQGVWVDNNKLFIADAFNHRVLIYNSIPTSNNASADVVIGQADMTSESANQGGSADANTLNFPTNVIVYNGKLIISDTSNNRVLIYNSIPTTNNAPADIVVGQQSFTQTSANQGGSVALNTLVGPRHAWIGDGRLFIPEESGSGSNRVLVYNSIPNQNNAPADIIIGQSNGTSSAANQGNSSPLANTLRRPAGGTFCNNTLFIADRINSRILLYKNVFNGVTIYSGFESGMDSTMRMRGYSIAPDPLGLQRVEYSINGSSWNGSNPADGVFDQQGENFYIDFNPNVNRPSGAEGFTIRVRQTHGNDIDLGISALYFEPFRLLAPQNQSSSKSLPTFSFMINSFRYEDIKQGVSSFRIMLKKSENNFEQYIENIPVDYEQVRYSGDNLQKSEIRSKDGIYEDKYKTVTYSGNNSVYTIIPKAINSLGQYSDKYREDGGKILSDGTYEWKVQALLNSGAIQETETRKFYVGTKRPVFINGQYFPLTILSITGLGNKILSTDYPEGIQSSYTTWTTTPIFYGLAWVGSTVSLRFTEQQCVSNCESFFTTIVNNQSRFGIRIPPKFLKPSKKYKVELSVVYNDLNNSLPDFLLHILPNKIQ